MGIERKSSSNTGWGYPEDPAPEYDEGDAQPPYAGGLNRVWWRSTRYFLCTATSWGAQPPATPFFTCGAWVRGGEQTCHAVRLLRDERDERGEDVRRGHQYAWVA